MAKRRTLDFGQRRTGTTVAQTPGPSLPQVPNKVRSLESSMELGGEFREGGARSCSGSRKARPPHVSLAPDLVREEAKKKVTRLQQASEALGDAAGSGKWKF